MSRKNLNSIFFIILTLLAYSCKIHSSQEIIELSKAFYYEEEQVLMNIVDNINIQNCDTDHYTIIYHGKSGEVSTINSETGIHFACYEDSQKSIFLRLLSNYKITKIRVRKGESISFGLKYSPEAFLHSGIIYLYDSKSVTELGFNLVPIGDLPKSIDNWIYPINEHWYIYVPKRHL